MEATNYGKPRHDDDEDLTGPPLSFDNADRDATDPTSVDEKLADSPGDRDHTRDSADERQVTSDTLAASFGSAETPSLTDSDATREKLQANWEDFQALQGRTAHDSEAIRQFHHAAVYAHANPVLADPNSEGPLGYMGQQPAYHGGSGNEVLAHSSVAYQNLIATETNRLWGHLSPNLERGVEAIPHIAERLEASSRHILSYTFENFSTNGDNHEGISWQNSREQNEARLRELTSNYTDWSAFGNMADQMTTKAHENGRAGHSVIFRDDEAGLLFATANSAHNELLRDRAELRQLTQQLEHANTNAPDHDEKLNKVLDLVTHMDYTAGLHGHANDKIGEILAAEQQQAEYENSVRHRIGQLLDSLRERLFGSTEYEPSQDAPSGPGRSQPALDYPNGDAFNEKSSLTELTALAFDRLNDPQHDEDTKAHVQALWQMMKSPRGDGDFWQAAAYGAANRELLDPRNLGVDQYMNYRPGLNPDTKEPAERSQELLAHAYRRNVELLYNEPHDVWQPGERSDSGLLTFNRIHRTLYASEEHMRAYNEHVATEGTDPLLDRQPTGEERPAARNDRRPGKPRGHNRLRRRQDGRRRKPAQPPPSGIPPEPGRRGRAALPHRRPGTGPDPGTEQAPALPDQHTGEPRGHPGHAQLRLAQRRQRPSADGLPDRPPRPHRRPAARTAPSGRGPRKRTCPSTIGHGTATLPIRRRRED